MKGQAEIRGENESAEWIPLGELPHDRCGRIQEVLAGEGDIERLMSMGVCAGRRVVLVRHGDPLILRVLGSRIGLSARLAERVRVIPCTGTCCERH